MFKIFVKKQYFYNSLLFFICFSGFCYIISLLKYDVESIKKVYKIEQIQRENISNYYRPSTTSNISAMVEGRLEDKGKPVIFLTNVSSYYRPSTPSNTPVVVERLGKKDKPVTPSSNVSNYYQPSTPSNKPVVVEDRLSKTGQPATFSSNVSNYYRPTTQSSIPILIEERLGEMGKPVILPSNLSSEVRAKIEDGWKKNSFNQYVSDLISVHRSLPDPRDEWCKGPDRYGVDLPKTSVIIIFYNEAWSVLLRSIYSVLDRSPSRLIEEVILVDDFSDMKHLKQPLEDYWAKEPKVKIIRNKKREGLIKARLIGFSHAKAEVTTFLDSHIEVAPGWLEPLLDRIRLNYTTVVCPVIDSIRAETLEYVAAKSLYVGGFNWNLAFTWHSLPDREKQRRSDQAEPMYSPTMAGGLFSISKKFFEEIGTYDDGFDIWGGENLELSFKSWMCGGTLEIVPCSHVGHIFRNTFPYSTNPYNSSVGVIVKNSRRLAEVWLDEYVDIYFQRVGKLDFDYGNVSSRQALRKNLGCQSFKWYIDNVYPELYVPENLLGSGLIGTIDRKYCMQSWGRSNDVYVPVPLYHCSKTGLDSPQFWYYSKEEEIRKEEYCVEYNEKIDKTNVVIYPCHGQFGTQQWNYDITNQSFTHAKTGKCLCVINEKLTVAKCDNSSQYQKWFIEGMNLTEIKNKHEEREYIKWSLETSEMVSL